MNSPDWDNEAVVSAWCDQQRVVAADYLARQQIRFGELGDWPAWHVAPYVAVWAVESVVSPGKVGWWVITGDLPTDYASGDGVPDPRTAVAKFAKTWSEAAASMERGEEPEEVTVGRPENAKQLGALFRARAQILTGWSRDASLWQDE